MYLGEIVEIGKTEEIFKHPKHPYTKALLSSVPQMKNTRKEKIILTGELPSPAKLPLGCKFHTRCPFVMKKCYESIPLSTQINSDHCVKCFLYE